MIVKRSSFARNNALFAPRRTGLIAIRQSRRDYVTLSCMDNGLGQVEA